MQAIRPLWTEPRAPDPPARVWRDWVLVAVLVPTAVLEGILRDEVVWRPISIALAAALAIPLLWRRTHPFLVVAVAFGATAIVNSVAILNDVNWEGLGTGIYMLLFPYALFRWGSGREALTGLAIMLLSMFASVATQSLSVAELFGAGVVLLFPAALGTSVRYQDNSRLRAMEQAKLLEREQLARELHDTVAHHVSAIAVQAQAGRAVAVSRPEAAVEALEVIEEEASRTLTEMRSIVGSLRKNEKPELAPQPGIADIIRLGQSAGDSTRVDVELTGDLKDVGSSVDVALFRLAQESITNAMRHAQHATCISVRVDGTGDQVRLTVSDDGETTAVGSSSTGRYGLVGMAERAKLLGGSLKAGPNRDKGWTVEAVLPRRGTSA